MDMIKLLRLMEEGHAWSVEALAARLNTTPDDAKRQIEFLERSGYLRRITGCGYECKGCSSHCGSVLGKTGLPVFWEVVDTKR